MFVGFVRQGRLGRVHVDLSFIRRDWPRIIGQTAIQGTPVRVVKIRPPSTQGRVVDANQEVCARDGIVEYRNAVPVARSVTVFVLRGDG